MNRPESEAASKTSSDATDAPSASVSVTRVGASTPAFPSHPTVLGGYRIVKLLGTGGMGAVYRARDDKLDRDVALKTMRPELAAQPEAVERFLREARAAAQVAHDNVVPIWQIGDDTGTPFIAMPLLEGTALDQWLQRQPVPPLSVVLKVGRETADGLGAAHARGLVHRDIKPGNIWIEGDPKAPDLAKQFRRVKILDFGLARPAADDTQLTGTGAVLGTPAYMSPEQARSEPVDHRTDLFSLGIVLYRMTTGSAPFRGATTMALLTSLAVDTPPAPVAVNPQVPPALSDLVMRLLAKKREDRPESAAEVASALREIGKQLVAAKKLAEAGPLPVVVHPVPITQPPAPEFNPFTELATEPPAPAAKIEPQPIEVVPPKRPGAGVWVGVGLALCLAIAAVVAVVKFSGPKKKESAPGADAVQRDPVPILPVSVPKKEPPAPDQDRAVAEWVLSVGGRVSVNTGARTVYVLAPNDLAPGPVTLIIVHLGQRKEKVKDADLERFRGLNGLRTLDLGGTAITNDGLAHLKDVTGLKTLILYGTGITDDGVKYLEGQTQLAKLDLTATKVTAEGIAKLREALPDCDIQWVPKK